MLNKVSYIRARRRDLMGQIDIEKFFEQWEESCVPAYCHSNWLAAYVSWQRLFAAVDLAKANRPDPARVLDFGSSVGEIGQILKDLPLSYEFIEQDAQASKYLASRLPRAVRRDLDSAEAGAYDWIFAIDSLEHNRDYAELLAALKEKLSPQGILILSGPTENWLYRLGRRIAGYTGHYHETNIYHIEQAAAEILARRDGRTLVPGLPLFSLSVWARAAVN